MNNIFDLVADFYAQDEEWNSVIHRSNVEDFLRLKVWQGASDDELYRIWERITVLCIYLGNSEHFLGDMTKDNFVDCVAWCARNVSGFYLKVKNVTAFLDTMSEFYAHLKKRRSITRDGAAAEAKAMLVQNGRLQLLDSQGNFLPRYERYNVLATPDLPSKIFLNIGEHLDVLMETLHIFFNDKKYKRDIERAQFLYAGILMSGLVQEKPGTEEYAQCFWDYFLFDYRMIGDDKCPLQHFADFVHAAPNMQDCDEGYDVLHELLQAELVLFTVQGRTEEGLYSCVNILSGEDYVLNLPFEEKVDTANMVFMGHIFYNKSMIMNYLRGTQMTKTAQKLFVKVMRNTKAWAAIRCGGSLSWENFIRRFPMLVRHMSLVYSAYVKLDGFDGATMHRDYQPAPLLNDAVCMEIEYSMRPYAFSKYDIELAKQLWSDYVAASGKNNNSIRMPEIWAAGVISCFIDTNAVYNYKLEHVSVMCRGVPPETIRRTSKEVKKAILLEEHDPRYTNEEGMLLLLLK